MPKTGILFAASEMTPIAKVGGLADVTGALPKALRAKGVDARIILPRYECIPIKGLKVVKKNISVTFGKVKEAVTLYSTTVDGVPVYLIDNDRYLSRGDIYFSKSAFVGTFVELSRFLFFSHAVVQTLAALPFKPAVVHCNDWHTAMIPVLFQKDPGHFPATVLTIHNAANQGIWNKQEVAEFLGTPVGDTSDESVNIFGLGLDAADLLTTVSPTYAQELLTAEYGLGLESILIKRKNNLTGILNGIDTDRFNPATDPQLTQTYSVSSLSNRAQNREALLKKTDLEISPHAPLFGFIGRLATPDQKGVELLASIADEFVKRGAGVVFLGSGDSIHTKLLLGVDKMFPKNIYPLIGFDAEFAQLMYAGCDFMLVPSRFEPCGLVQMIAMRYGSIPVVRHTGGLADSVDNAVCTSKECRGTGIVFRDFNQHDLREAVDRACHLFQQKRDLRLTRQNAMTADFSWDKSAKKYLGLYQSLL